MTRRGTIVGGTAATVILLLGIVVPAQHGQAVDWAANGRDVEGTRYLPATGITRQNVSRLEVAWTYRTGEADPRMATKKPTSFEATPLVVDGTMYIGTPLGRVIALDPATGTERWTFDPAIARDVTYGDFASRGVSTWLDASAPADAACRRRIFVATAQSQLIALDARSGRRCAGFGKDGMVDLTAGLRIPPFEDEAYSMTSPPVVVNGVVVTGSSIGDNSRPTIASGEVRGYDARTGGLQWTWDPIPQDPKDPAYGDWRGAMAHKSGGANAWSVLSADPARDLVFVPTGSAAPDYYGALRLGDNRYANSIVALKAATGQVAWAFQTVHHDLWDYDNASPPALTTVTRNGARVPAVLQATKTGMLFVLNRDTGQPIFPVEERPVPSSDIPLEEASRTQPFTTIAPLSPHRFPLDQVWGVTDADRTACRAAIEGLRNEGIFTPPSVKGTVVVPSNIGGAHWGGLAVDPERQIAVVPVNRIAAMVQLIPREGFDLERARPEDRRLGHDYEYNMMRGTPYVMRRRVLLGPSGLPCSPPPFGTLVAIDLETGGRRWEVPLGSATRLLDAAGAAKVPPEWGSPNLGGPIVVGGGVVFIGAALDRWLHAYDVETGRELWKGALPESGKATPMSYQLASGEQYVSIAVGGGGAWGTGDHVIAFRLGAGAQTTRAQPQLPRGQMPDLGRHTKHDDEIPLFDFDAYFAGKWSFQWDMPEGPLGPAGRVEGTTTYVSVGAGTYEAKTQAEGPSGKIAIREVIRYQKEQKTLTREVTDSRGFAYTQTGTIGGDLGGLYTIYLESAPFTVNGRSVRLKHVMRLTSPLHYRVSTTVAEGEGPYRNYGTPWWRKEQ
jgi:quinoprotein glucose dehydrogenase